VAGRLPRSAADPSQGRPLREVMSLPGFRRFLGAQFLSALVNGTSRFVLVWLTLELTDWTPAVGLVGVALGASALIVAAPAGAMSDRVDRRRLFLLLSALTSAVLAVATLAVAADAVNVAAVALVGALVGGLLAATAPAVQAMVPDLVPKERLMNGVALQFISMNVAMMLGALAGGAAIALAGNAGGLGLLALLSGLSVWLMAGVHPPRRDLAPATTRLRHDIADGMRWALGHEPARTLLGVMLLVGVLWGGTQLLLPDLARDELGQEAFGASVLFAPLGLGMMTTSLVLASRHQLARRRRLLSLVFTANAGPLVIVLGWSRSYVLTFAAMAVWGIGGGIVMTLQRTLLQERTPADMMGRVMGLNTLALLGSFPLAAALSGALTARYGTGTALVCIGVGVTVVGGFLTLRPSFRRV
jgi:MFS family permease